jgi:hypothetical protein
MFRRVALVRIDVSEKLSASFIRVTRIGGLGTTLDSSHRDEGSSETSVLTRIPEDTILHIRRREYLKSYKSIMD